MMRHILYAFGVCEGRTKARASPLPRLSFCLLPINGFLGCERRFINHLIARYNHLQYRFPIYQFIDKRDIDDVDVSLFGIHLRRSSPTITAHYTYTSLPSRSVHNNEVN